jgi:hypothetical protein
MRKVRILAITILVTVFWMNTHASAFPLGNGDYDLYLFAETYNMRCFPRPLGDGDHCIKWAVHTLKWSTVGSNCSVTIDGAKWSAKCGGTMLLTGAILLDNDGWLMKYHLDNAADQPLFTTNVFGTGYFELDFLILSPKSTVPGSSCP